MTKSMKKAAAVIAASVLCMSMSVSVFATPSDTQPEVPGVEAPAEDPIDELWNVEVVDKDGKPVSGQYVYSEEVSKEVADILKDEEKVKDILDDAGYDVKKDQEVVVIGAGDYHFYEWDEEKDEYSKEFPKEGVDLQLDLSSYMSDKGKDLKAGDTVYVLHLTANGKWEVLEGTVEVTNVLGMTYTTTTVHFDSLSPVAVVKVMSDGEVVVLDGKGEVPADNAKGQNAKTSTTSTGKKSPKTGN